MQERIDTLLARIAENSTLMGTAAKRIEALEAQIRVMQQALVEQSGRINALRAALREIAELKIKVHSSGVPQEIARAALAPEDK